MPFPILYYTILCFAVISITAYFKVNSLQLFYLSYVFMFVALLI